VVELDDGTQVMEMAIWNDDQVLQLGKEEREKQNPMEIKAKE
jgi:hypothetical protein